MYLKTIEITQENIFYIQYDNAESHSGTNGSCYKKATDHFDN